MKAVWCGTGLMSTHEAPLSRRPRPMFSLCAGTLADPDRRSWPFIGPSDEAACSLSYRIPPPTAGRRPARPFSTMNIILGGRVLVIAARRVSGTAMHDAGWLRPSVAWWRRPLLLLLLLVVVNRFSRRRFRIKSPSSAALWAPTICHRVFLSVCVFISLRIPVYICPLIQTDRQTDCMVTWDVACHLIASHHTSRHMHLSVNLNRR